MRHTLAERAWRMLEAGDDIHVVHTRTGRAMPLLERIRHDIDRERRRSGTAQPFAGGRDGR
ncbi:hypothetical protein [Bifidobacterium choerinum]|uniref:hypothetical protein n=1 Tax=Bifidobacterium choerinum TaxID=35760 RepID=UPI003F8E5712